MEESNPWPTFVDAFSTMLCIFIFLMLVFVLNSMLVMYESSKKSYTSVILQESVSSPTAASVSGTDDNKGSSSTIVQQQGVGEITANESQVSAIGSNTETSEGANSEDQRSDVIRLASNESAAALRGENAGKFDSEASTPSWEVKDNQFIVRFKSVEQAYPENVIAEMSKWLGQDKPVRISVYANITPSIAVSDAMRLAYGRGVILLKIIKEKYPSDEVSISVISDANTLSNTAVITKG